MMKVILGKGEFEFPSAELGELRDCNRLLDDVPALQARMDEDGYLLVRGMIDRDLVLRGRRAIVTFMRQQASECFQPGTDPMDAVYHKSDPYPRTMGNRAITHDPAVRRVLEGQELFGFFERYFGQPARTFDYKWLRPVVPGSHTGAHYDFVYMGRGSTRLHTAWVPFGDNTPDLGSLAICVGSHRLPGFEKLRNTYGKMDVDRDKVAGWFSDDPREVTAGFGGSWATTSFRAGDVILFGMHTMHMGTKNLTDRWRLSCDVRFQPAADPVDERWVGENPIAHYAWNAPGAKLVPMTEARAGWGV